MAAEVDGESRVSWKEEAFNRQKTNQEMYYLWKLFDEDLDGFMKTNIGILLFGLVELPDKNDPPLTNEYHKIYNSTQKKTITTIASKIRTIFPPPENVSFGCTFLTARVKGCDGIQEYVLFRCATETKSKVHFIEPSGRVYRNWQDFVKSNKLPHCTYFAPSDGVYELEGTIAMFTSPEAKKNFVRRHVDKVMTAAGVGIIGASALSMAPVTAAVTGIGVSAYSVCQSAATLYDRHKHSESIRPNNLEAISSHLTIVTAGLTGASSAALACRQQIMCRFGKWAPAFLRAMNISVLTVDTAGLLFSAYVFKEKCKNNDVSFRDTFNLVLQVYLLHGQVSNTIEIHRMLTAKDLATPARLTKTQKRNLRKRRAKAAKRGEQLSPSTVRVTEASGSTFESMALVGRSLGFNTVTFLCKHFPREQVIMEYLADLKQLISKLWRRVIKVKDFLLHVAPHARKLWEILQNDTDLLRQFLSWFGVEPSVDTVAVTYNSIQRVSDSEDNISEKLDRMIEQIPGDHSEQAVTDDSTDAESATEPVAEVDVIMKPIDVKVILDAVEKLVSKCIVHENKAMFLVFGEGVKYIRSVIVTELLEKYELAFSKSMDVLNDEQIVAEALGMLGVKIGHHFFPARALLVEKLSEAVEKVKKFVEAAEYEYAVGIQDEKHVLFNRHNAVCAQIAQSVASYIEAFLPDKLGAGLKETLDLLEYVTNFYINEKLVEFDKQRTDADKLFQVNADIFGREKADEILAKVGMSIDPVEIALKCTSTELNDAQLVHLLRYSSSSPESTAEATENHENAQDCNFEDDFLLKLTMNTCAVFMNKIKPLEYDSDDPQKLLRKVVQFVLTQFARDTNNSIEQFQRLSSNLDILGPANYKMFLKKLRACPQKNRSILLKTSEKLMAFGDDVGWAYFELFSVDDEVENVKIWQSFADEEGLQVKSTKNCSIEASKSEFKHLAERLFHVEVDANCSLEKYKNSVILISDDHIITFNLDEASKTWLVILSDRRVDS